MLTTLHFYGTLLTKIGKAKCSMNEIKTENIPIVEYNSDGTIKKKRGRPRKADVAAKKPGNRGQVGRPPGDAARINEFKARLLATAGDNVINKIIQVALDDEHPGQMAALKMCMDRVLPLSYFDKDKNGLGKSSVSITITGVTGDTTIVGGSSEDNDDVLEGEYSSHE